MTGSIAKGQQIRELFRAEKIDRAATTVAAVAILCERSVAPPPPTGSLSWDDDAESVPYSVRQATFLAFKIIPQYQPRFIPFGAQFTTNTKFDLREFRPGEPLDSDYINQTLATMLAELLGDRDLDGCSAISLNGNSPALGETRFGVVAAVEA